MANVLKSKSAAQVPSTEHRARSSARKGARKAARPDRLRSSAESINSLLAEFHAQTKQQDLAGYLWTL